jgi:hypothetical protein
MVHEALHTTNLEERPVVARPARPATVPDRAYDRPVAESGFSRETVTVGADGAPPALRAAIEAYAEKHELGDVAGRAVALARTTSVRERRRLGRSTREMQESLALVAPGLLVWAVADGGKEPVVLGYELKRVELDDYASSTLAALVADTGIEVTGPQIGATVLTASFLGLGAGGAAERFRAALAEAARGAGGTERLAGTGRQAG